MVSGVYVGSFDPLTKGHQDIIDRALKFLDKLTVVVMNNPKKTYWFSLEERKNLIKKAFENNKKVEVKEFTGLIADFMKENNEQLLIKGLRNSSDFTDEMAYFWANNDLTLGKVETIFIPSSKNYLYVSSTFVKELALAERDLKDYVDEKILNDIYLKVKNRG